MESSTRASAIRSEEKKEKKTGIGMNWWVATNIRAGKNIDLTLGRRK